MGLLSRLFGMSEEKKKAILIPLWSSFLGKLQEFPELPHAVEAGRTTVERVAQEILAEWQAEEEQSGAFLALMGGKKKLSRDHQLHFELWEDRDAKRIVPLVLKAWFALALKWEKNGVAPDENGQKSAKRSWRGGEPVTMGQYLEANSLALDLMAGRKGQGKAGRIDD